MLLGVSALAFQMHPADTQHIKGHPFVCQGMATLLYRGDGKKKHH